MDQIADRSKLEREPLDEPARPRRRTWRTTAVGVVAVLGLFAVYFDFAPRKGSEAVALGGSCRAGDGQSAPAARSRYESRLSRPVLGDRSGRTCVPRSGEPWTEIHFKGRPDRTQGRTFSFVIDPRPYEIRPRAGQSGACRPRTPAWSSPTPSLRARKSLRRSEFATQETVDPAHFRSGCIAGPRSRTPRRASATPSSIWNIARYGRHSPAVSARAWYRSGRPRCGQPRRHQPDHPADNPGFT